MQVSGTIRIVSSNPLNLANTLPSGQSFRWKLCRSHTWIGVIDNHVISLKQNSPSLISYTAEPCASSEAIKNRLIDYFRLESPPLRELYRQWGQSTKTNHAENHTADINADFKKKAQKLDGLRLLRQDPYECTFCFICSQNNHTKRISSMVETLCNVYGSFIATVDGVDYYAFPKIDQLLRATEPELRGLGFGYRSKYIVESAKIVKENGGETWLRLQKLVPTDVAKLALLSLPGIGHKVADCIALFSMERLDVVPVDTHVWKIAMRYLPKRKKNSSTYQYIADFFKEKFGPYCGWAHTILFAAELKTFQTVMDEDSKVNKSKTKAKKTANL
ncbi:N-glycosylase/DNA lyase-like [Schistocerca gregaria]|uniref:N-glycosylase/DNA lyase-like n=1 Tax=Schistocerca gregaria TaxID=7010 RepID=UPI00211DCB78|nr:N-glycosylase/DNA lyase-like [Schistocerca gregaria]